MGLSRPGSAREISQKAKVDVKRKLSQSDPFVARSYLGAIISGICNRVYEFYAALAESEIEANPKTAIRNLTRWASVWGINRLQGTVATGSMWLDSSQSGAGTEIPIGTELLSSDGMTYSTQSVAFLQDGSLSEAGNIEQSSGVATFETSTDHGLASNAIVTISGANESGYNLVDIPITVTSATQFTYEVDVATSSPSTGSPVANISGATIEVSSVDSGSTGNASAESTLTFSTPIDGVDESGRVTFAGLTGGTAVEKDDALRKRLLDRIQNPVTGFNESSIRATALEDPGVTRVFVQASTPSIGQVTVYFMRDNDSSPIPSPVRVAFVKIRLDEITPADVSDSDVIVSAPTGVETDFTFTALSPDSTTMREAITASLTDYFKQTPSVGVAVEEDAYRSVIFNTIDPADGSRVTSFTLSTPAGLLSASSGQIRILGNVVYSL